MKGALALALALFAAALVAPPAAASTVDPITRVVRAAQPAMARCASLLPPHDRARLTLSLVIAPDGHVIDTGIDEDARGFRGCVRRVAVALVFPPDPSGVERRARFPLRFSRP